MILETITGIGLVIFLLMYFINNLPQEHFFLKLLTLFFIMAALLLIPKALLDSNPSETICTKLLNSTQTFEDNTTAYTYTDNCITTNNPNQQANTSLFKTVTLYTRLFATYIIIYIIYFLWLRKTPTWIKISGRFKN